MLIAAFPTHAIAIDALAQDTIAVSAQAMNGIAIGALALYSIVFTVPIYASMSTLAIDAYSTPAPAINATHTRGRTRRAVNATDTHNACIGRTISLKSKATAPVAYHQRCSAAAAIDTRARLEAESIRHGSQFLPRRHLGIGPDRNPEPEFPAVKVARVEGYSRVEQAIGDDYIMYIHVQSRAASCSFIQSERHRVRSGERTAAAISQTPLIVNRRSNFICPHNSGGECEHYNHCCTEQYLHVSHVYLPRV